MKHILRFRAGDKDIWQAIKNGKKKVETRAGTVKYQKVAVGDELEFVCVGQKLIKKITKVEHFKSVEALCKKYRPSQINPNAKTEAELIKMYSKFSGYTEKIKKYGLLAWTLK